MGMMSHRGWIAFLFCVLLLGCAGFTYHYYGLSGVSYENGVLLGPKESDDIPFKMCEPNNQSKSPCVVMFAKEFFAFKQDYLDLQMKLKECEKKNP